MLPVMVYFRVASQLKEITMTQDHMSTTPKPRLDDLLATMGVTPEQLVEMTADDLFAAATRWQDAATVAAAETQHVAFPGDHHLDTSSTPATSTN